MAERRARRIGALALALALVLAGCGSITSTEPERLSFEDRLAPEVFDREAFASRDSPDGAPGLWATVAGLPRPERARIVNPKTRKSVEVALFAARRGTTPEIRLSIEASDALGIGETPANVHITALRRQAEIDSRLW